MSGIDLNDLIEGDQSLLGNNKKGKDGNKASKARANLLSTSNVNTIGKKALELGNKKQKGQSKPPIKSFKTLSDDLRKKISLGLIR